MYIIYPNRMENTEFSKKLREHEDVEVKNGIEEYTDEINRMNVTSTRNRQKKTTSTTERRDIDDNCEHIKTRRKKSKSKSVLCTIFIHMYEGTKERK